MRRQVRRQSQPGVRRQPVGLRFRVDALLLKQEHEVAAFDEELPDPRRQILRRRRRELAPDVLPDEIGMRCLEPTVQLQRQLRVSKRVREHRWVDGPM